MTQGAQHGEDIILDVFFQDEPTGYVVDVGAADGVTNSNTWRLLKRPGWCGVLIEPEPHQYQQLAELYGKRRCVLCVDCAIGLQEGPATLWCCDQVSTLCTKHRDASIAAHGVSFTETLVRVTDLTSLLRDLDAPKDIDFISIDAEGLNYQVWQTLDLTLFYPKLVCIEGKGYAMPGYREFCLTRGNTFYLREDLCCLS